MLPLRIVVIGGGAAGFFGAIAAATANPEAQVTLLEASRQPLAKVRISGGGRCNVTHACFDPALLVQNYPRGGKPLRGAFSRFQATDTIAWFKTQGVKLKTEADGRMFPTTDNSETIVNCLMETAQASGVEVRIGTPVVAVKYGDGETQPLQQRQSLYVAEPTNSADSSGLVTQDSGLRTQDSALRTGDSGLVTQRSGLSTQDSALRTLFKILLKSGEIVECDRLLLATGNSPVGYKIAKELGHTIEAPVPSLFTFNIPDYQLRELAGVSVPQVRLRLSFGGNPQLEQTGPLLITHWGLSGPAVLKLSAWGARILHDSHYQATLLINWLPDINPEQVRQKLQQVKSEAAKRSISLHRGVDLPHRLWQYLISRAGISPDTRWAEVSKAALNQLVTELTQGQYTIKGKGAFKEEFVTCGGVNLREVNFKTMESRILPGLYFAGEILDIDGVTGGFNFQSAWTTAYLAGNAMGN